MHGTPGRESGFDAPVYTVGHKYQAAVGSGYYGVDIGYGVAVMLGAPGLVLVESDGLTVSLCAWVVPMNHSCHWDLCE